MGDSVGGCPYCLTHAFCAFFGTLCSSMSPRSLNAKSGASAMARFSAMCLPRVDLRPQLCSQVGQYPVKPRHDMYVTSAQSGASILLRQ